MFSQRERGLLNLLFATVLVTAAASASAQSFPSKPIRILVGYPTGGPSDVMARLIGQKVAHNVGQPVIVDNRPGAGGNIAAESAAKARADGHTILQGGINLAANIYTKLNYDPLRDLAAVTQLTDYPLMLVTHPSLPVKNVEDLISLARAKPGYLYYASAGNASAAHLFTELLRDMTGINIVHVPYKGFAASTADVVAGRVPMQFGGVGDVLPLVKTGSLRALGVTTTKRVTIAPNVPTIAEAGVPGYTATSWFGVFAPASTPESVVAKLHAEFVKALQARDVHDRLLDLGQESVGSTPEEFSNFYRAEIAKWTNVIKKAGIRLD